MAVEGELQKQVHQDTGLQTSGVVYFELVFPQHSHIMLNSGKPKSSKTYRVYLFNLV